MDKLSLIAQARNEIEAARRAPSGRSAKTVHGGHEKVLRQTVIALCAGRGTDQHENPGEATVQVITGRIRLATDSTSWDGGPGHRTPPAAAGGLEQPGAARERPHGGAGDGRPVPTVARRPPEGADVLPVHRRLERRPCDPAIPGAPRLPTRASAPDRLGTDEHGLVPQWAGSQAADAAQAPGRAARPAVGPRR